MTHAALSGGSPLPLLRPGDLDSPRAALGVFREACRRGSFRRCPADLLAFLGLLAYARRHAPDPRALLAWLVRARAFDRITDADDDAARSWARLLRDGAPVTPDPGDRQPVPLGAIPALMRLATH